MLYKEWLNEWLQTAVKPTVKDRTYDKYDRIIRNQILPSLGDCDIKDLSALVLQSYSAEICRKYSANSVVGIINVVRSSLDRACKVGLIERHYADCMAYPKHSEKRIECFSAAEQKQIESYIDGSDKDKFFGIILCLYTGLRIGELLALKWSDIDFDKGLLSVTKTCYDTWENGKYVKMYDAAKTPNSVRVIPVPKQLLPRLKAIKKRCKSDMVVSTKEVEQISIRSYQRTFELLLKRINIPHKGFHALRHTFATRAIECGMDVRSLSEILGHKNPTITLNRYTHSLLEHKTAMMNKLGKLYA